MQTGLTTTSSSYISPSNKPGGLLMFVKIRTWQKCRKCGGSFSSTETALICLTCQTIPTKYYLEWWYKGERYYYPPFNSFVDAQRRAVQIENEINSHQFKVDYYKGASLRVNKKFQFAHLYDEWLQGRKKDMESNLISPAYYDLLSDYKKLFSDYFQAEDIRLIKTYEIKKFFEFLAEREVASKGISTGRKLSGKTKKNIMGILRKFFCDALDMDLITELPKFPKIILQEQEMSWIDAATQVRIFSEIPAADKPIFEFLRLTGLRPAEGRALKWGCVVRDAEIPYINIKASFSDNVYREITKVKRQWQIPIRNQIATLLKNIPRNIKSQFVFTKQGEPYHEKALIKIWNRACERAGVKITMYQGLRHSWASQRLNEGVSLTVIGASMGHTNPTTTRRYAHLDRLKAIKAELGE